MKNEIVVVAAVAPSQAIVPVVQQPQPPHQLNFTVDQAIAAWLLTKRKPGSTARTVTAYRSTIETFRDHLARANLDLDSPSDLVALAAQVYSTRPAHDDGKPVTSATANRRLAAISSFYNYCLKSHVLLEVAVNPIAQVERQSTTDYEVSVPHTPQTVKERLAQIDRSTLAGARDYALLLLALTTGRRLSEVAGLRAGSFTRSASGGNGNKGYEATFRCKGNKIMRDRLSARVCQALDSYMVLRGIPTTDLTQQPADAPVWVALDRGHYGQPLTIKSLAVICKQRIGTSKFHSLRHTFAHTMEEHGAKVSEIQSRLGHSSLDTTGRYLAALKRAENSLADDLADEFGGD